MPRDNPAERWLQTRIAAFEPRTKSLIVTVFGDSVEPHGGSIWLGSLARLLAPFGILERAVRTGVFRLVKEDWLEPVGERIGRRSFYRLTASGRTRAAHAHRRIYHSPPQAWNGTWTLLLLEHNAGPALRHDLQWQGFGRLSSQVYGHPAPDPGALREIVATHGDKEGIVGLTAGTLDLPGAQPLTDLVRRGWPLAELAAQYARFTGVFEGLLPLLRNHELDAPSSFLLRTMLIHEFRRAQLRDPRLPAALLPSDWPGIQARDICQRLYLACTAGAERYLEEAAEGPEGLLRPPAPYFFERFRAGVRPDA